MSEIKKDKYDTEFIKRTKLIIKKYQGEYEITLLLNCLLGLIILPSEYYRKKKLKNFDVDLNSFKELINLLPNGYTFDPTIYDSKLKKQNPDKKTLKVFLKKIRNGIAHQNIEPKNIEGKWVGITIKDINKNNHIELDIYFDIVNFKKFVLLISNEYLNETNK